MAATISTPIELTATEQALAGGRADALQEALKGDPCGISKMQHPPYKFALRALEAGNKGAKTSPGQDEAMVALFRVVHIHASDPQNAPKELRLACEMAMARDCPRAGMALLDLGATLSNDAGSRLVREIWEDPDGTLDGQRARHWKSGGSFRRQDWEHRVLGTMALAGASTGTMEAFAGHMHSPLCAKALSRAVNTTAFLRAEALLRNGSRQALGATPASLSWLALHLGREHFWRTLDEYSKNSPVGAHLFAQMQAALLDGSIQSVADTGRRPRL